MPSPPALVKAVSTFSGESCTDQEPLGEDGLVLSSPRVSFLDAQVRAALDGVQGPPPMLGPALFRAREAQIICRSPGLQQLQLDGNHTPGLQRRKLDELEAIVAAVDLKRMPASSPTSDEE